MATVGLPFDPSEKEPTSSLVKFRVAIHSSRFAASYHLSAV